MRNKERFDEPYPPSPARAQADDRFNDFLDVDVLPLRELQTQIYRDLDPSVFGVGWWARHPLLGDKARIAIGDHLLTCVNSVEVNLAEARLHLFEVADHDARQDDFVKFAVVVDATGKPVSLTLPPRTAPIDDYSERMGNLHVAGFFRAIGSALDCLGAIIVGVVALDTPLLKTNLDRARAELAKASKPPTTPGGQLQANFGKVLEDLIKSVGPEDWLEWSSDYRNMLVHRGRRLTAFEITPRGQTPLYDAYDKFVRLVKQLRHLPLDPRLSDVEVFSDESGALVLGEQSSETMNGVICSALDLVRGAGKVLLEVWLTRRATPALLAQPPGQWKTFPTFPRRKFVGYTRKSFAPDALTLNPFDVERFKRAALFDGDRQNWKTKFT